MSNESKSRYESYAPEDMWARFMVHMATVDPIGPKENPVVLHGNFLGEANKYRALFLEANRGIAPRSELGKLDDPFCWYRVIRDITDEYVTVYSETENCPGPDWKPLYER